MTTRPVPRTAWKPGQSGNPAGRPKRPADDVYRVNLALFHECLTHDDLKTIYEVWISRMKAADPACLKALVPYVLGAPPRELRLDVEEVAPLRIIIED